jgi:hypothetical protein
MILFGRKHLHVSESDQIIDSVFKILSSLTSGSIKLEVSNQPAMKIEINTNDDQVDGDDNNRTVVRLDLLEPTFFSVPDDQTGLEYSIYNFLILEMEHTI